MIAGRAPLLRAVRHKSSAALQFMSMSSPPVSIPVTTQQRAYQRPHRCAPATLSLRLEPCTSTTGTEEGCVTIAVPEQLRLDPARATQAIAEALRQQIGTVLRRSGLVVAMSGGLDSDRLNIAYLAIQPPGEGQQVRKVRLPAREFREIVAATNFKQRVRKMLEYYHADRLHYAVVGTPNRLEYELGFFVKGGDGLADVKPIAHLYKSQVYQLAEHLGVPAGIRTRVPTTDTYSLPQTQEEFFFSLPLAELDLTLQARNAGRAPADAARDLGLTPEQVERAYRE